MKESDPKEKNTGRSGEKDDEKKEKQGGEDWSSDEEEEEFPDIYKDKDDDFNDPDEREIL